MKYLIVIPARGGSKGIPMKNIYPLSGKPLLDYSLQMVTESNILEADIAVSTDSEQIADVARKYKGVSVIKRPDDISGDNAPTEDALIHALYVMEGQKKVSYDAVITIQPASPLRKIVTFRKIIKEFEQNFPEYDAIVSLHETKSDYWIREKGCYSRLFPDAPRRRQEREPLYIENSAYYITAKDSLINSHSVLGNHVNGFVISEIEGIDINEPMDLSIAEVYLKEREEY